MSVFVLTLLFPGSIQAQSANADTVIVQVELPGGGFTRVDTLMEGETFMFTGFAHPFHYLNGGELSFPDSSLSENVVLNIQVPNFASIGNASVSFGDSMASGVSFHVTPQDSAGPVSPYVFELPVELTLPIPTNLPPSIGSDVSTFVLAFRDTTGNFDTTGVSTTIRDAVRSIVSAQVGHFSDIVMTSEEVLSGGTVVGIPGNQALIPVEYSLDQNYPNPFNPTTTISYSIPENLEVTLNVYDIKGRMIRSLVSSSHQAGWYTVSWNGATQDGNLAGTGVYFARIQAGGYSQVIKMVYLR